MGGALGLSILSGVAASVTTSSLGRGIVNATLHGYHVAFVVSAGFMVLAALVALVVIRDRQKQPSDATTVKAVQLQASANH
jgi:hypothetical protein